MRRALFLDRDGTLIEHVHYIKEPEKVKLILPIVKKVSEFQEKGFLVVIVTNQRGIGKGEISMKQYEAVNARMLALLAKEGVKIDHIEMCPALDDADRRRKPNPGMILDAAKKMNIGLKKSVLVGDEEKDAEAGRRAGVGLSLELREFLSSPVPE